MAKNFSIVVKNLRFHEIINLSKKSLKELLATGLHSKNDHANSEIEVPKKDAYLQNKDNKLLLN